MPVWTESQKRAIETQNRSLLVGAGAGSGKTTVLTERILRRLVGGGSVDRLLVVTFTKSAAADMKEKLYAALSRAIAARPNDRHLRSQLYRLSGARICTIHSFCYELIRRNFASLGLSPKVRVADSAECAILSKRCITETLEHFYETGGDDFFALLGNFDSEKSDEPFVKLLLSCYDRIRAYPDYLGFLDQVAAGLGTNAIAPRRTACLRRRPAVSCGRRAPGFSNGRWKKARAA
ncbi:MAG: UvrD-helicase domain-containing protein [Acutalibacteraceae bacterium]